MHGILAVHVVLATGIEEVVALCAGINTCTDETECVLRNTDGVVVADDKLQTALQVACTQTQVAVLVALGVLLGSVHIAFAIHHLIVVPVYYGTACHTHLKHLGEGKHKVCGHETAETPSVHTHTVLVHIGQRHQELYTLVLVLALHSSQLAEGSLLELAAAPFAATSVQDKHDISLLCHVCFPATA